MRRGRACVLGAGMQGITAALALSHEGWSVTMLDRADGPFLGASFRGEGKLHLGYVYANDPSRRTARLMVESALCFGPLLDRWLPEPVDWASARSRRFAYAILDETMVGPDDLLEHYAWVDDLLVDRLGAGDSYAGSRSVQRVTVAPDPCHHGYTDRVAMLVHTDEVALDPQVMRRILQDGLAAAGVTVAGSTTVTGVERSPDSFTVHACVGGRETTHDADIVVNCLWDGRLAIDRTIGIEPPRSWTYRLKYGVHGRVRAGATPPPTTTFALGPFGDIVHRAGDAVYLSWYPECLAGFSTDDPIPDEWRPPMNGADPDERQADIAARTVRAMTELAPAVGEIDARSAAAGVIVAWGETDIDDHASGLHQRSDIGVHAHDGYFSIDTGKLTSAPMHAADLIDALR